MHRCAALVGAGAAAPSGAARRFRLRSSVAAAPGRLDDQFEVREAGDVDGLQLIELRTRSAESEFERVLLGLRNDTLELMIMEDAFGLRTELRFLDIERNPELDDALFTFVPPEGADVIGEVAIVRPLGEP